MSRSQAELSTATRSVRADVVGRSVPDDPFDTQGPSVDVEEFGGLAVCNRPGRSEECRGRQGGDEGLEIVVVGWSRGEWERERVGRPGVGSRSGRFALPGNGCRPLLRHVEVGKHREPRSGQGGGTNGMAPGSFASSVCGSRSSSSNSEMLKRIQPS